MLFFHTQIFFSKKFMFWSKIYCFNTLFVKFYTYFNISTSQIIFVYTIISHSVQKVKAELMRCRKKALTLHPNYNNKEKDLLPTHEKRIMPIGNGSIVDDALGAE